MRHNAIYVPDLYTLLISIQLLWQNENCGLIYNNIVFDLYGTSFIFMIDESVDCIADKKTTIDKIMQLTTNNRHDPNRCNRTFLPHVEIVHFWPK